MTSINSYLPQWCNAHQQPFAGHVAACCTVLCCAVLCCAVQHVATWTVSAVAVLRSRVDFELFPWLFLKENVAYAALCCALMLCFAMVCCAVLCCAVLCRAVCCSPLVELPSSNYRQLRQLLSRYLSTLDIYNEVHLGSFKAAAEAARAVDPAKLYEAVKGELFTETERAEAGESSQHVGGSFAVAVAVAVTDVDADVGVDVEADAADDHDAAVDVDAVVDAGRSMVCC